MLKCSKCGVEKDEKEFHRNSSNKTGYNGRCKECTKEIQKKYGEKRAEYQKTHRELKNKINKRYRISHSDATKESKKRSISKKPHYYTFSSIYYAIRGRCNNPRNKKYRIYGGKGVRCLRKTFKEFYDDMYQGYLEHGNEYGFGRKYTQIDRIDDNGNYCKSNCRRVTAKENNPANKAKEFSS